ncbi:MAG: DUF3800 domain-containing protein [Minisyncoccia bacterium]
MAKEKHYLYVDDSGWRYPDQDQSARNDGMDYFALGGILIRDLDRDKVSSMHSDFCDSWNIKYPLHSSEIRGRRNNFGWLKDDIVNERFNTDLMDFLCELPVMGFAVVVDRKGYNKRYKEKYSGQPWWMCKTAFSILIERVSKHIMNIDRRFKIVCEQCGKKEDRAIAQYFKDLRKDGHPFNPDTSAKYGTSGSELFQQIPYGDPEFHKKKSPFLQIADLYLYPMVKGGYDQDYIPYTVLKNRGKLIDSLLDEKDIPNLGIKYSCFNDSNDI